MGFIVWGQQFNGPVWYGKNKKNGHATDLPMQLSS